MKKIHLLKYVLVLLIFVGCTEDFAELNKNPYQISDESLRQDNNHVGAFFPTMLNNVFGDQIEHNLAHESFVRHLATPTPFVGGVNNTTYYIRWNTYWNRVYGQIMAPVRQVLQIAEEENNEVFTAWAKLIRVLASSRLSAYHGPIIYSNYGSSEKTILYDTEADLYNKWFSELDEIEALLTKNVDFGGMANFDESFGGDVGAWIKLANSLRLRLAMRISKVNPALAKTQGEKAIAAAGGMITTTADNFMIKNYDGFFRPARICFGWGDTRMSATMESVLGGYEDPRASKYFDPATDDTLYPDHPDFPYKGIRNGAELVAKDDRLTYSTINSQFNNNGYPFRRCFTSSETHFLLAEASLRGWAGAGSAQEHYEAGVRESFDEWGAGSADAYLMQDDTKLPWNYDDPKASGEVNDFVSRITVPVMWDEAEDKEIKLEKIMTQKWLAAVHNTIEIWVDHRRTGYPKLPFNYKNDSNADWGVIADDDFLRRMPFVNGERNNNPDGVADATSKLGGPDEIGTRLWWDTGGPNFP
ncbi:MAG: SusD/RagB family nutrient-binding outer membrane lipoprotein [Saprospiraceae bacterium]|nr:SusD/RagB family nutrient-binding outer membrane lipoprotein [Saprospiraceae bacterium]